MNVNQHGQLSTLFLLTSMILLGSVVLPVLAQDTIRPEIYSWGIDGDIGEGPTFIVWANVTDNDSGVQNVTANVRQDGGTPSTSLMTYNSTFYTVTLQSVELNHTYVVWVEAYDNEGNVAVSYNRNINLMIITDTTPDPSATLPYVVSASLLTLIIALGFSYEYNKRNPRPEQPLLEEEVEFESSP